MRSDAIVRRMRSALPATLLILVATIACSGGGPTAADTAVPASTTPSNTTVQRVVSGILNSLVGAINTTRSRNSSASVERLMVLGARPEGISCNASGTQCQVFEQSEDRSACPGGGYEGMSLTMSGTVTASTTSAQAAFRWDSFQTMVDCSRDGWVTNSNPYLSAGGTIRTTTTSSSSRTVITLTLGGGFVMTNAPGTPAGRLVCANSGVILQWDDLTGWSNSGTLTCDNGLTLKY